MDDPAPPLVEVAIEPKSKADQEKLAVALAEMAAGDPSFTVFTDPDSGQTILNGASEQHLDAKIDILIRTYKFEPNVGAPQVAYRETIKRPWAVDHTYKRQAGPMGQFARVLLAFAPGAPGSGYRFINAIRNGAVPDEYVPGIEKGIAAAKEKGLVAGFPLIDFEARLIDGAYHDVDSSPAAFETAARAAFKELRDHADPILLEPIMEVEVLTPHEYLRDVGGDLSSRRAQLQGVEQRDDLQALAAHVRLSNMFGYAGNLRGMTRGTASFTMRFDHYAPVPPPDDDPELFPPAAAMRA